MQMIWDVTVWRFFSWKFIPSLFTGNAEISENILKIFSKSSFYVVKITNVDDNFKGCDKGGVLEYYFFLRKNLN